MEKHDALHAIDSLEGLNGLQHDGERLRAVQKIAQVGLWELRIEDRRLTWTDEARSIAGIAGMADESFGDRLETYLAIVHPEDRQRLLDALEQASRGTDRLDIEHRLIQPHGELRHVHLRSQLLRNKGGQFLLGTLQDITQQKLNDAKFQQSEALLRIASRMAHIGGWKVELPERRLVWSDEVAVIHEIGPDTSPTFDQAMEFYVPEWRDQVREAFEACARDGVPYDLELQICTARRRRVWVRAIGQAVRDANQTITQVQGAFQDITEKKQVEENLRRMARRLNTTLESVTDAFYTVDRSWRLTYMNTEAEHLLRRPSAEVLGKVLWDEFKETLGSTFDREYHRAVEENCPVSFEEFYAPLNIWTEVRAYPSDEGLAVYFNDITERKRTQEALRESEERFKIVAKATSDAIWDWNLKTNRVWWNEGIQSLFGFPREEVGNAIESWTDRIHSEDRERVLHSVHAAIAGPDNEWRGEYRFLCKDGSYAYVQDRGFFIRDHEGKASRMIGAMVDITERKRAELEREEAATRILRQASLLDKAQDAIIVSDMGFRVTFWNKGAERLLGWTAEEIIGKRKDELIFVDPGRVREAMSSLMARGDWTGELMMRRKDGRVLTVEAHWTLLRDESGQPESILGIDTDITQRKKAEREIETLAFFDPLTRLPNRRLLLDRLQHALATAHRIRRSGALLFIDLDNFKTLNDTLGHDIGDMLLQQVARRLEACAPRKSDTVARLGGDEFVVMLEELSEEVREAAAQAELVGEKILAIFTQPFVLAGYEHYTSPSIGVALFNHHPGNVDEMLKRADLAMYQAKASGRNTIRFFDPEMQTVITARVALETDLRQGLQRHEFFLHYQSQTDSDRKVIGAEALTRWQHPRRGLVSPALFIPLAEETGMILQLGRWVLETACRQLAEWATKPKTSHLTVSVNVSARQFRQPDFVEQVLSVLDFTGADPHRLKIELTESLLVQNIEGTITKMSTLKARGVSFSLDDFGTGYSSLSYLKRLPLDQLKIDQSFVRDVLTDPNDAAIARTIVALGQTLGLDVIAEGVETEDQREFLAQNGCHAFQGYLFSQPLPAEHF